MADLEGTRRIHLVGAGGAGMSALAKLLDRMGHRVSGSDLKPGRHLDALGDLGMEVWVGSRPDRVGGADLVVASSAVPDTDPELSAAGRQGVEVWRRPRLLEAITARMPAIGITGTHGKTTGTALAVTALRAVGRDPSFVVGGELSGLGTNAHLGERELFVLEADEAFATFRRLRFAGLLVTNVEADHLDHYGSVTELEAVFAEVVDRVEGPVVVGIDDAGGRRLAERTGAVTCGTSDDADWHLDDVETTGWRVGFSLTAPDSRRMPVEVPRPGLHVARDAAGVVALLAELGFDARSVAAGLGDFQGVHRRFEIRGRVSDVTIVDDYAHHPTEVAATLEAARGGDHRRVWAVFQPHLYSRTARLYEEFARALGAADRVVVTDVYPARETPQPGVTGELIAKAMRRGGGPPVTYVPHRADLADHLAQVVEPGDLVLTLGAGDITVVGEELARRLAGEG